ncbi:thymine DNA glycosylase isoform X5 [Rhipicephalus microplus]|uniref:thymine DNA glycosylase isoform X5 n=1 Tax=Rhipicephalus microplus TaxID=6941 RepID=UPI003F6CB90B
MNGEGKSMDNYRGSVQTWNPPVTIKQEPEYDLYGETAQSHHNHRMQHAHQQHHPSSHHSRSEFVSLPYFQQQQQQYMMPAENGCHYHMTEVGRPGEEEEDSLSTPKKRGRKKKIKVEDQDLPLSLEASFPVIRKRGRPRKYPIPDGLDNVEDGRRPLKQEKITDSFKQRKRIDRFEGMPEEEVAKRTLPDHLVPNLDIVIIGINPGLFAAFKGHHYAGPGNHFWRCLFLAGLIPEPMTAVDDFKLIHYGIGFTNIVARTTRSSADLSRKEIKEGAEILLDKLKIFQPRIAVFNGKGIYEIFSGNKNFVFGRQPEPIEGTNVVEAKEEPCDDDDASDPFSTEGTDDGSSGYDGNNTFHVQSTYLMAQNLEYQGVCHRTLLLNAGAVINFKLPTSRDDGFVEKLEVTAGKIDLLKLGTARYIKFISFQILWFVMNPSPQAENGSVLNKDLHKACFVYYTQ